ncbi:uncharacterized protein LOC130664633 [Microplitis mediator]|uniref:uncharacterized protein LOC130664633 n=1 Tax=Microplitis mediator TaxID=375433 RepID=UPI00255772F8|nr:uncharacterized protein LOC130664633 [Microplitis mediator]
MPQIDRDVNNLIDKYCGEEKSLREQLKKCEVEGEKKVNLNLQRIQSHKKLIYISNEEARERNRQLLEKLELSRARLRTLTSFTPTDQELGERAAAYRKYLIK